jgi:hypothetical protein
MRSGLLAPISRLVRPFLNAGWASRLPSRQLKHEWLRAFVDVDLAVPQRLHAQDFQLIGNTASRMKQPAAIQGAWFLGSNTFVSA